MAARILNSSARAALRVSSRPARFTHVINRSNVTAPASTASVAAMFPTMRSASVENWMAQSLAEAEVPSASAA
jgi:hypothetical protein